MESLEFTFKDFNTIPVMADENVLYPDKRLHTMSCSGNRGDTKKKHFRGLCNTVKPALSDHVWVKKKWSLNGGGLLVKYTLLGQGQVVFE
jgi:hypothetical protein